MWGDRKSTKLEITSVVEARIKTVSQKWEGRSNLTMLD